MPKCVRRNGVLRALQDRDVEYNHHSVFPLALLHSTIAAHHLTSTSAELHPPLAHLRIISSWRQPLIQVRCQQHYHPASRSHIRPESGEERTRYQK